jgi:hypothetical protein
MGWWRSEGLDNRENVGDNAMSLVNYATKFGWLNCCDKHLSGSVGRRRWPTFGQWRWWSGALSSHSGHASRPRRQLVALDCRRYISAGLGLSLLEQNTRGCQVLSTCCCSLWRVQVIQLCRGVAGGLRLTNSPCTLQRPCGDQVARWLDDSPWLWGSVVSALQGGHYVVWRGEFMLRSSESPSVWSSVTAVLWYGQCVVPWSRRNGFYAKESVGDVVLFRYISYAWREFGYEIHVAEQLRWATVPLQMVGVVDGHMVSQDYEVPCL